MLLIAALISLTQAQEIASPSRQPAASYLILADELRRARVERLIADLTTLGTNYRAGEESGLYYVNCVTAWGRNPPQAEDCIRSRLPHRREAPLVVLNTYHREARQDVTVVICIGPGGSGRAVLRQRASRDEVGAMRRCFDEALRNPEAPALGWYNIRHTPKFADQDAIAARASAASVLRIAVDHVGVPRGSTGSCLVQGRVSGIVKGAGLTPRGRIEISIPCGTLLTTGDRRLLMRDLREGAFANVYLSDKNYLLDYEPLQAAEAPQP